MWHGVVPHPGRVKPIVPSAATVTSGVLVVARLRPIMAPRRPDRRAHGVGSAGPRGPRVRVHRRRLARGRSLRGAARARAVRRVRELAPPRGRTDGGHGGAVGRRGRRPGHEGRRRSPRSRPCWPSRPGSSPSWPASSGSGFVANFISEPVLKGFIIGLALTIMIGQVPKLLGVEKGEGDFFEQLWDFLGNLGDTQGRTLAVGLASLATGPRPPPVRAGGAGVAGRSALRHRPRDAVRPRRPRRGDRRSHRQRSARARAARRSGPERLPRGGRLGGRDHAGRLRRGSRCREDLRLAEPLRDRSEPRAARSRRRRTSAPGSAAAWW